MGYPWAMLAPLVFSVPPEYKARRGSYNSTRITSSILVQGHALVTWKGPTNLRSHDLLRLVLGSRTQWPRSNARALLEWGNCRAQVCNESVMHMPCCSCVLGRSLATWQVIGYLELQSGIALSCMCAEGANLSKKVCAKL